MVVVGPNIQVVVHCYNFFHDKVGLNEHYNSPCPKISNPNMQKMHASKPKMTRMMVEQSRLKNPKMTRMMGPNMHEKPKMTRVSCPKMTSGL